MSNTTLAPDNPSLNPPAAPPRERLLLWLRLAHIPLFGPILIKRILDRLHTPEAALTAHPSSLFDIEDIGPKRAESFVRAAADPAAAQVALDLAESHAIRILTPDHPEWPPALKHLPDPPIVLYARGHLQPADALAIGIVGARHCTLYGREQAERFAAKLAAAGLTIISGGARGIDTGAHLGALRAKGRTIVIQGCGLLHSYPPENRDLYDRIVAEGSGAVLSELPLDAAPVPENFPPRNRIIAGMSLGILVVEANQRSGSLITARLAAADYGREVFALPGRVDSAASAGTHHLIKTGTAHLVENVDDILTALGDTGEALKRQFTPTAPVAGAPGPQQSLFTSATTSPGATASGVGPPLAVNTVDPSASPTPPAPFTAPQRKILAALASAPVTIDDLCASTNLPAAVIMAELTMLQIRAAIHRTASNRFAKSS